MKRDNFNNSNLFIKDDFEGNSIKPSNLGFKDGEKVSFLHHSL